MTHSVVSAAQAGSFTLGELSVNRLGFGSMQLPGPGVWGEPQDPAGALRVLRRAVDLSVNFIDTADSYGPFVAEELIKKALYPYPDELVIATKAGLSRQGPDKWTPIGRPEYLRQQAELSLRHLGVERIDLLYLHRIDRSVPLEDQVGELAKLQREGKIRHIGLSEVSIGEIEQASKIATIVAVQNLFNLSDRSAEPVVDYAASNNIGFIPWFPLATGELAQPGSPLAGLAAEKNVTPSQLALAWLLKRSPVMLPIPGTSSVAHLEANIAAAGIQLSDSDYEALAAATSPEGGPVEPWYRHGA